MNFFLEQHSESESMEALFWDHPPHITETERHEPIPIPSDTGSLPPVWWNPPYQFIPQPVETDPTHDEDLLSLWATADELAATTDDDVLSLLPRAGEGALDSDAAPTSSRSHIVSSQESEDSREFVDQASTLGTASDGTTGGYLASGQSDNEPLSSRYCDTPSTPPLGKRPLPNTPQASGMKSFCRRPSRPL